MLMLKKLLSKDSNNSLKNNSKYNIFCVIFFLLFAITLFMTVKEKTNASTIFYRDDGFIEVHVEDLIDLSEEDLKKVVQISIKNYMPDVESLSLFEKCINLETVYFTYVDVTSLTFLNNVSSNNDLKLYFLSSNVDFRGFDNDQIISLNIANSQVKNFKQVESLISLEQLGLSETSGYETIDFSKFSNLSSLSLATYIEDFEVLINSIPNVTDLSLATSNIQNKDTIYLERLTNLKSLNLNQTYLTDIDFVKKLTKLESLVLPWAVTDLSPIYELKELNYLQWEAYTELNVSQELVDYLDENNISHYDYNSNINGKIKTILNDLNLTKETDTKVALEKIVRYIVENTNPNTEGTVGNPSNLDLLIFQNIGVCYHHSIATYTLAKVLGIDDIYAADGILLQYTSPILGNDDGTLYSYGAHSWNVINYDDTWYGIDAAQMNDGSGSVSDSLFNYNFWKNPLKDDDYDLNYANQEYLDFNYYFAKRHIETDGILKADWTYQFNDITGLDIRNHVIYNYDINDDGAVNLCNRVLDNYVCQYLDKDSDEKISTGDEINIIKNNIVIETFILSTESWVAPVPEPHLGKIVLEYVNYSFVEITGGLSDLYYNKANPLRIKIKGSNYISDSIYDFDIKILDLLENKEVYNDYFKLSGNEINSGKDLIIAGDLLNAKEVNNDMGYGVMQYIIVVKVNDIEREYGLSYTSDKNNNDNYVGYYDGEEHTINVPEWLLSCSIKYSVNNSNFDLDTLPKFKEPGEYVVTYLANCGYGDIKLNGNVKIYGIKKMDSSVKINDNLLISSENSYNDLVDKITTYSVSSVFSHYDKNNIEIDSDIIKTGDFIKININNSKIYEYNISILGDTNGDGEISLEDIMKIANYLYKDQNCLSGAYLMSADYNNDAEFNLKDIMKIANKLYG